MSKRVASTTVSKSAATSTAPLKPMKMDIDAVCHTMYETLLSRKEIGKDWVVCYIANNYTLRTFKTAEDCAEWLAKHFDMLDITVEDEFNLMLNENETYVTFANDGLYRVIKELSEHVEDFEYGIDEDGDVVHFMDEDEAEEVDEEEAEAEDHGGLVRKSQEYDGDEA